MRQAGQVLLHLLQKRKARYRYIKSLIRYSSDTNRLKIKVWGKTYQTNSNPEKGRLAILTLDKVDFRAINIKRYML